MMNPRQAWNAHMHIPVKNLNNLLYRSSFGLLDSFLQCFNPAKNYACIALWKMFIYGNKCFNPLYWIANAYQKEWNQGYRIGKRTRIRGRFRLKRGRMF